MSSDLSTVYILESIGVGDESFYTVGIYSSEWKARLRANLDAVEELEFKTQAYMNSVNLYADTKRHKGQAGTTYVIRSKPLDEGVIGE